MLDNEPTGVPGDEPAQDAQKNDVNVGVRADSVPSGETASDAAPVKKPRRRAASRPAGPPQPHAEGEGADVSAVPAAGEAATGAEAASDSSADATSEKPKRARKTAAKKTTARAAASADADADAETEADAEAASGAEADATAEPKKAAARTRTRKKAGSAAADDSADTGAEEAAEAASAATARSGRSAASATSFSTTIEPTTATAATGAPASATSFSTTIEPTTAPAASGRPAVASPFANPFAAPAAAKAEPAAAKAETKTETKAEAEPQTAAASAATPEPEAEAAEPKPKTRTRRRAASAPAGPPRPHEDAPAKAPAVAAASDQAEEAEEDEEAAEAEAAAVNLDDLSPADRVRAVIAARAAATSAPLFQAPDLSVAAAAKQKQQERRAAKAAASTAEAEGTEAEEAAEDEDHGSAATRRTRNRNRNRNRAAQDVEQPTAESAEVDEDADLEEDEHDGEGGSASSRRRRRRRRRTGEGVELAPDDPSNTVVKVREVRETRTRQRSDRTKAPFGLDDDVQGVRGSTRLEAKKQRRREGRDTGRRRAPLITEAEFLARRESVERVMVVRQSGDRTQIGVLEDGVLVEHYVNRATSASYVGNVYLGKVQNVLPSMEAAFVDIGKGRNAVLYAGEVNFDAAGITGQAKRIESVLKSGQAVLTQVTKDPIGHKGARLTSQVSLPGRYLVYVPEGSMTGISRKLPENERTRLKAILKQIVPEDAGVIVRTAAEGASEDELRRDVERLAAQWSEIQRKAQSSASSAPTLLYGEPDLTVRVVRDIFNEDFVKLIVSGQQAWDTIAGYVDGVAPDLSPRLERWTSEQDVFAVHRIDEQLAKALDRKVWLPSGGSLVIDRTEAMVVIDVNTGKFTGSGGNLEETVTRNNIEAAEEIVRQLRLRDLGGIVVIDFIDMVLESNRDLVMRRLLECLGRDRTKHQVAEVTSLGLVQMTRKRVGQGLLEAFSETCDKCNGRGVLVHMEPVAFNADHGHRHEDDRQDRQERGQKGQGGQQQGKQSGGGNGAKGDGHGGGTATATDAGHGGPSGARHDDEPESGRSRRKRRKSHGHLDRQAFDPQYDVDGVPEEFGDFADTEQAAAGPVTVKRISEEREDDHARVVVETETVVGAGIVGSVDTFTEPAAASTPAPEVAVADATFPAGAEEPVVTASAQSEEAVEAALGGSGTLSGDTAAPKKRGLRVRRAAKRPAGPPSVSG
jgi:ribonuclease E